jgi:hypothetical protein
MIRNRERVHAEFDSVHGAAIISNYITLTVWAINKNGNKIIPTA